MDSKKEISSRFIEAYNALLSAGLTADKKDFATKIGISPSMVTEISKGRSSVGTTAIQNIVSVFDVSATWLLTGNGEMLAGDTSISQNAHNKKQNNTAIHSEDPQKGIPLIPISAMAGALTSEQTVLDYECERYIVPMFKGADFLIPVKGSSMYPKYSSGDVVACQRVPMTDLFFQWNKVYVIDTTQGALIKRIKPGSDKEHLLIVSDNESYDPFELPIQAINAVALVIGVIRLE